MTTTDNHNLASGLPDGEPAESPGFSNWAARATARLLADMQKKCAHTQPVAAHAQWVATRNTTDRDHNLASGPSVI